MPRIIYSPSIVANPDVQTPQRLPDDYQLIGTDTAMFGGMLGAAEQQAGAKIEQGGAELGDAALKIQTVKNTTDANSATSQYLDRVTGIFYGDGTPQNPGLFNRKGRDALDALPDAQAAMKQAYTELGISLGNPVARNMFNAETRRYLMAHTDELFRFGMEQQKNYAQTTNDESYKSAVNAASLSDNNPAILQSSIDSATGYAIQQHQLQHGFVNDDTRTILRQKAVTDVIGGAIDRKLSRDDITGAQGLLDQYGSQLDPLKSREWHEHIKRRLETDGAKSLGDDIYNSQTSGASARPGPPGAASPGGVDAARRAASVFKNEFNWTDAAVSGALNNSMQESNWRVWNNPGAGGEQGMFQFHPGSHLPTFLEQSAGDMSPEAQARYVGKVVNQSMPEYRKLNDAAAATRRFHVGFEAPKDQSQQETNRRFAYNGQSQSVLAGLGSKGATEGQSAIPANAGEDTTSPPAPNTPPSNPYRPMPSLEQLLADPRLQGLTEDQYEHVTSRIKRRWTEDFAKSADERRQYTRDLNGGVEMLSRGQPYSYDSAKIDHLFPPEEAREKKDKLEVAAQTGQWINRFQSMKPEQIDQTVHDLQGELRDTTKTTPEQFPQKAKIVAAAQSAAEHQANMLGTANAKEPQNADPVNYLLSIDNDLQARRQAINWSDPRSVDGFANVVLERQANLGVPPDRQHIMTDHEAQTAAHDIAADPAQTIDQLAKLKRQWGNNWSHAWYDITTKGNLPETYQMVEHLADTGSPHDAALVARSLDQMAKAKKTGDHFWSEIIDSKTVGDLGKSLKADPTFQAFVQSLWNTGTPGDQMQSWIDAIHTLTYAKKAFDHSGDPIGDAIQSVISKNYEFLPEFGNARVPLRLAENARNNGYAMLDNINPNVVVIPNEYGNLPGQPKPTDYIAMIKAKPVFATGKRDDRMYLLDNGHRFVRDAMSGEPLSVPFDAGPGHLPKWMLSPESYAVPGGP